MLNHKDILDEIVSIAWLYEKIFWKLLDKLVFKKVFENKKHILKKVYWFTDIDEIFEKQIERREFEKLSKVIFRFYDNKENGWIFNKNN
jgi:hypothetical protein